MRFDDYMYSGDTYGGDTYGDAGQSSFAVAPPAAAPLAVAPSATARTSANPFILAPNRLPDGSAAVAPIFTGGSEAQDSSYFTDNDPYGGSYLGAQYGLAPSYSLTEQFGEKLRPGRGLDVGLATPGTLQRVVNTDTGEVLYEGTDTQGIVNALDKVSASGNQAQWKLEAYNPGFTDASTGKQIVAPGFKTSFENVKEPSAFGQFADLALPVIMNAVIPGSGFLHAALTTGGGTALSGALQGKPIGDIAKSALISGVTAGAMDKFGVNQFISDKLNFGALPANAPGAVSSGISGASGFVDPNAINVLANRIASGAVGAVGAGALGSAGGGGSQQSSAQPGDMPELTPTANRLVTAAPGVAALGNLAGSGLAAAVPTPSNELPEVVAETTRLTPDPLAVPVPSVSLAVSPPPPSNELPEVIGEASKYAKEPETSLAVPVPIPAPTPSNELPEVIGEASKYPKEPEPVVAPVSLAVTPPTPSSELPEVIGEASKYPKDKSDNVLFGVGSVLPGPPGQALGGTDTTAPPEDKKLSISDYLRLAGLAAAGIGALGGDGTKGTAAGNVPGGLGKLNPIFSSQLPTGTGVNIPGGVGAASNLAPRAMGDEDWLTYGQRPEKSFFNYVPQPTGMAHGGSLAAKRGGTSSRSSFAVSGPGTGRSDDIPAVLSDGEYVIDAETVALLGDGSSKAGAQKLDDLRVKIRKHKGQKLSQGRFSANAKKPEAYLTGGRI